MNLKTDYMGMQLQSPLIASASPMTADLPSLLLLQEAGAGAVVLPSLFAEEIDTAPALYLDLVRRAVDELDVPVIASLNGGSAASWMNYARQLEDAGAHALELNIYFVASDLALDGHAVEQCYLEIVHAVRHAIRIPIAVKLSPYFSAPGHFAIELAQAGANAVVLFNRFYQPDIDTVRLKIRHNLELSRSSEMRLPLLWTAILHGNITASLAASTGVQTTDDVLQYLLAGADVVMTTSALLRHGAGHMRTLVDGLASWLERRGMDSPARMRGMLSQGNTTHPEAYQRANYIKVLESYGHKTGGDPALANGAIR